MTTQPLSDLEILTDIFTLENIKGFGPQKFKELHGARMAPADVIARPGELMRFGKRGGDFSKQLSSGSNAARGLAAERARRQLESARASAGALLTYDDPRYPKILYDSNIPIPVLYARGDLAALSEAPAVACVGSRKIRPPYASSHQVFAKRAVGLGFTIVSGFATGADIIGHLAAEASGGRTVCVMPSGLDRPFPPEHKDVWRRFIDLPGAVFVSEFGFGIGANALNLRKRNKLIAGMAGGVLVSQSAEDGGAMNAYRFAMEQRKPIATFRTDGAPDTSGNDLIAGSAERACATVLEVKVGPGWAAWLRTL